MTCFCTLAAVQSRINQTWQILFNVGNMYCLVTDQLNAWKEESETSLSGLVPLLAKPY